jgi:hypothetical protein
MFCCFILVFLILISMHFHNCTKQPTPVTLDTRSTSPQAFQMSSKASIFHHPIHPMTVVFPLGLWFTSIIFDVIYTFCSKFEVAREVAYYLLLAGIVGAGAMIEVDVCGQLFGVAVIHIFVP